MDRLALFKNSSEGGIQEIAGIDERVEIGGYFGYFEEADTLIAAPCRFQITRVKCKFSKINPPVFEVCANYTPEDNTCIPRWKIIRDNQVIATATGNRVCMEVNGTESIEIEVKCGEEFICKSKLKELRCQPYCDKWKFQMYSDGCRVNLFYAYPTCNVDIGDISDEGLGEGYISDFCYHTCCKSLAVECDPCAEVDIKLCEPDVSSTSCCNEVIIDHPYEGVTEYVWRIRDLVTGALVHEENTSAPRVNYLFINEHLHM